MFSKKQTGAAAAVQTARGVTGAAHIFRLTIYFINFIMANALHNYNFKQK